MPVCYGFFAFEKKVPAFLILRAFQGKMLLTFSGPWYFGGVQFVTETSNMGETTKYIQSNHRTYACNKFLACKRQQLGLYFLAEDTLSFYFHSFL